MSKVIRKLRNMFFPKKHDEIVVKIVNKQKELKIWQVELNKINYFAENGILGDKLLDRLIMLEQNVRTLKNDILLLKWRYQNKLWRGE